MQYTTKQSYLPSSNILLTRYIQEDGVADVVDFFPRPKNASVVVKGPKQNAYREVIKVPEELKKWLVRRVEVVRGTMNLGECLRCCLLNLRLCRATEHMI